MVTSAWKSMSACMAVSELQMVSEMKKTSRKGLATSPGKESSGLSPKENPDLFESA